jgi:SAM-dependent methyltransferase
VADDAYFSTRLGADPARRAVWRHIAHYLRHWVPADGAVLDLAAGWADFAGAVTARRRVAFDRRADLASVVPPGVEAVVGDVVDLGAFDDASFDAVMASNLLEHLDHRDVDRCLGEVHRVLKPGGHVLLIQPNFRLAPRTYFDDYTHRTIFTDRSLADRVTACGFHVVRVEARFLPLTLKSRLKAGHRLVPWYLRLPWRPLAGQMLVVAQR